MPRKKKEEVKKEEIKENVVKLNNIDHIMKEIKKLSKSFDAIIKYDGITIEFVVKSKIDTEVGIEEVKSICNELKLKSFVIERNEEETSKFILQFPDMTPVYTEAEKKKLYKDAFKWLLDDTYNNEPSITKQYILDHKDNFVRQAITIFYRFNVNKYKETLEMYLGNVEYRQKITIMFVEYYLSEYLK